ncbi:MAG: HAD hydrolase family protein [Defluviitaleaceae bacterium]|nr:HAD hydrolase family protein [Defluviitaleaceae bacterium]
MNIRHLVIDVDGTLTDSGIYYDNNGNELKKFSTRDGAAIIVARAADIKIIILTGRESHAVLRRMTELKVDIIQQNIQNKRAWLSEYMSKNCIPKDEIGFIGDDLIDLEAMKLCGFVASPVDACKEVKAISTYISSLKGGEGAVRDCIEFLLSTTGEWERCVKIAFGAKSS